MDKKFKQQLGLIAFGVALFTALNNLNYISDFLLTRPLSSRHFLWTPVMRYKHNGLPLGFVLS